MLHLIAPARRTSPPPTHFMKYKTLRIETLYLCHFCGLVMCSVEGTGLRVRVMARPWILVFRLAGYLSF